MDDDEKNVTVYFEDDVMKKEGGVNNWVPYWAVIRGKWLQFYEKYPNSQRKDLRRTLEITPKTQCSLVKRKKRRFPFSVNNGIGVYYLKCETELQRYHWILSVLKAAVGKPKSSLPKTIPNSMIENKEIYRKSYKDKQKPSTPTHAAPRTVEDFHTKRRKKYAQRSETRMKRKEAKLARKQALKSGNSLSSTESSPIKGILKNPHASNTLDPNSESFTDLRKCRSMEVLVENRNIINDRNIIYRSPQPKGAVKIRAQIHSPTKDSRHINNAYDDDEDIDILPSVPVILNEQHLLPNMIVSEFSDSDSDSDNTTDTSLNSQCSRFLSLSSTDIRGKVTTQTLISTEGDHFEQRLNNGRLVSSPLLPRQVKPNSKNQTSTYLNVDNLTGNISVNNGGGKQNRPTSPAKFSRFLSNTSTT